MQTARTPIYSPVTAYHVPLGVDADSAEAGRDWIRRIECREGTFAQQKAVQYSPGVQARSSDVALAIDCNRPDRESTWIVNGPEFPITSVPI